MFEFIETIHCFLTFQPENMEGNNIPTFVERKQGGVGLELNNFQYTKRLQKGNKIYYHCRDHKR